ncbi:MAG: cysteine desulfurase [Candidatus Portnoybacteria bacterium]|nr:cysteine desulfurase [Candidatus Portnoybacteria bacterium]
MKKKEIYLDNSATTSVDPAVFKKMQPYFYQEYGNPSSIHKLGERARQAIEKAREQVANFLNCLPQEIYFTAGATESNNWLIYGVIDKIREENSIKPHIIISAFEHKSVIEPAKYLEKNGLAELTLLPVSKDGLVELAILKKAIKENTRLISIMYANNEIGTIQPIKEIGKLIKEINQSRKQKIVFHTDAVQAINYLDCNVDSLGIDALSLSGHKIYGPKGVGILYLRKGIQINPLIQGGGQERKMRSGTENLAGIVGLGEVIKKVKSLDSNQSIKKLRNKLITGILKDIPNSEVNGSMENRLPNNAHISFKGAEGESIVMALSQKNVFVSTASACASHSLEPSYVLIALGLTPEQAHCSVRFSLGRLTNEQEIRYVLKVLPDIIKKLRKISGK